MFFATQSAGGGLLLHWCCASRWKRSLHFLSMHNNLDLIITLAGGLIAALALGLITDRVGLSPIVGYLLAGILVGPHTPGIEVNQGLADQLAEVGVILLMFGVGLQFHFK